MIFVRLKVLLPYNLLFLQSWDYTFCKVLPFVQRAFSYLNCCYHTHHTQNTKDSLKSNILKPSTFLLWRAYNISAFKNGIINRQRIHLWTIRGDIEHVATYPCSILPQNTLIHLTVISYSKNRITHHSIKIGAK